MRNQNIIITSLVAGLALVACGDSEEPLSKAEFIEQADALCASTQEEAEPIFESVWAGLDDVDFEDPANELLVHRRWADAVDELLPMFEDQLDDIADLKPPSADEDFVEDIIADQRAAMADFRTTVLAAAEGDQAAMEAMESDEDSFADIDRRLREYGLVVCGASD